MRVSTAALIFLSTTALAAPAHGQSTEEWGVTLTPYVWISWPEGDIEAKSGASSEGGPILSDINASFDDVGLSGAFTGSGDLRYRNFGLFGDLTYYELEASKDITVAGDVVIDGEFEVKGTKGMLVGYWRFYEDRRYKLDLLGGVHYLKAELGIDVSTANRVLAGSVDEDWVDPVIGVRGEAALSENFGLEGFATYGGFGVASEELYEVYAAAYWRFNRTFRASLGYRYFTDKFEGDNLRYEASFSGPLAGLTFGF